MEEQKNGSFWTNVITYSKMYFNARTNSPSETTAIAVVCVPVDDSLYARGGWGGGEYKEYK